jgi:hypothetical protein
MVKGVSLVAMGIVAFLLFTAGMTPCGSSRKAKRCCGVDCGHLEESLARAAKRTPNLHTP